VTAADEHRAPGAAGPGAPDQRGSTDPDAVRADIDAAREQLAETVDELAHRLDLPGRAKESALRARDTAVETYRESPPAVLGVAAALVALVVLVVGVILWRRKR
jgi:hypothetical protein